MALQNDRWHYIRSPIHKKDKAIEHFLKNVSTESILISVNQVKIPWLMTRMSMISTQWQGCWSCISEDWRTHSSQRSVSWTSSLPSVSHVQQKVFKAVTVVSERAKRKEKTHLTVFFGNSALLKKRKACGAAHGSNLNTRALRPTFNRKPVGRGAWGPHQPAVCNFTAESFPRCF